MSSDVKGGLEYGLLKNHYDCDDSVSAVVDTAALAAALGVPIGTVLLNGIPFTLAAETFYVSGLMAYLTDLTVFDANLGWCLHTHGQPAAPAWLAALLAAANVTWLTMIPGYPNTVPAFEAKDTLFYPTQDCWVKFNNNTRVRHFLPANTYHRTHRRWFRIFVQSVTAATGTLYVWING